LPQRAAEGDWLAAEQGGQRWVDTALSGAEQSLLRERLERLSAGE
jgi:hypothetical protein